MPRKGAARTRRLKEKAESLDDALNNKTPNSDEQEFFGEYWEVVVDNTQGGTQGAGEVKRTDK